VEPGASIVLYGSRARGDAAPDSDWDLLVLLDGPVDARRAEAIYHRLYELELALEDCPVLSPTVHSQQEWESPLFQTMPFHERVTREGIVL
jgi:predicted nucleotidyltransferase